MLTKILCLVSSYEKLVNLLLQRSGHSERLTHDVITRLGRDGSRAGSIRNDRPATALIKFDANSKIYLEVFVSPCAIRTFVWSLKICIKVIISNSEPKLRHWSFRNQPCRETISTWNFPQTFPTNIRAGRPHHYPRAVSGDLRGLLSWVRIGHPVRPAQTESHDRGPWQH